jgi:hypothetical protein
VVTGRHAVRIPGRPVAGERVDVLKMTWLTRDDGGQALKLEGELAGPWVEELRNVFAAASVDASALHLDLAVLTFVNAAGVQLLRDLARQGVRFAACSNFVAELLRPPRKQGPPGLE